MVFVTFTISSVGFARTTEATVCAKFHLDTHTEVHCIPSVNVGRMFSSTYLIFLRFSSANVFITAASFSAKEDAEKETKTIWRTKGRSKTGQRCTGQSRTQRYPGWKSLDSCTTLQLASLSVRSLPVSSIRPIKPTA